MIRKNKRLIIAIVTFIVGIVVVWLYEQTTLIIDKKEDKSFSQQIEINLSKDNEIEEGFKETESKIKIEFVGIEKEKGYCWVHFRVFNDSMQIAHYFGYEKGNSCNSLVKTNFRILTGNRCMCGTGLGSQDLFPGESIIFTIFIMDLNKTEKVKQVGFNFTFGQKNTKKTCWTDFSIK